MKRLTEKQQKILDYIAEFTREQEIAPTVHELASHFGIKSSTMFIHLRTLQRKNCLVRNSKARSIKLLSPDGKVEKIAKRSNNAVAVPVIENFKPEMIADPAAYGSKKVFIGRDSGKFSNGARIFAVRADNKLVERGIMPGDLLLIAAIPGSGKEDSLVMVEIDHKAWIGILGELPDGTKVLNFANKDIPPVKIPVNGPQIIGTVVAVHRYF
jgi:repressor LexA